MKRVLLLLSLILFGGSSYAGSVLGDVIEKNATKISWKEKDYDKTDRSLFPISGYVEDTSVTLYLYDSPTNVLVFISNISGGIVYECIYPTMSQESIDLSTLGIGMYEIVVEYGGKSFIGHFLL